MDPLHPHPSPPSSILSSAFYSTIQSPSSLLSEPQFSTTHLDTSSYADPPLSATTHPPINHTTEHLLLFPSASEHSGSLDLSSFSPRVRSCDVFLGHCVGLLLQQGSLQLRFVKWLRAELEMHGVSCFVSDRRQCNDAFAHTVARAAMDVATISVIIISKKSFTNPYSIEEIKTFLDGKKLVPVFFGLTQAECTTRDIIEKRGHAWEQKGGRLWKAYGGLENDWREAVDGLTHVDAKVEANASNMRDAILDAVVLLGMKLKRRGVVEKTIKWKEMVPVEYPFPRNNNFIGRKKELLELELLLFGDVEGEEEGECIEISTRSQCRRDSRDAKSGRIRSGAIGERVSKELEDRVHKGKAPMVWVESNEGIQMQGISRPERHERRKSSSEMVCRKGIACVTGGSGMGKTELLLEFAYRFAQRYKMVLWIGGEARYVRCNYMKLLPLLGVDVDIKNELCLEKSRPGTFKNMEEEAIRRVRKELMRDVPFLLVIDNLESEKDWWDGRNIMELLPRFGGQTHVLISTRLPQVMNVEPLRLSYLSATEAMSLMVGSSIDLPNEDFDALGVLEEKVGRLPLGLSLVGAIISELSMNPSKLLDTMNRIPLKEFTWSGKEEVVLRHNPSLIQLLDVCFSILDHAEKHRKLATKMLQASGWFAPSSIPISVLALAAHEIFEEICEAQIWKRVLHVISCMCMKVAANDLEAEASSMLVRFRVARCTTKIGYIHIHDIVKLYARKKGDVGDVRAMVRAISKEGSLPDHSNHILAACFLLFKFGTEPAIMNLSVLDLMLFIKQMVLPLAMHIFRAFSQCNVTLELLRLSTEALEFIEDTFLSDTKDGAKRPSSKNFSNGSAMQSDPLVYQEYAHLRATLLETRANIMLKGGMYDVGEQLCRTAMSIKEVIYGWEHSETISTRQLMERLIRIQSIY